MEVGAPAREAPGFWESVKEAIRGSHQDYTEGNLGRAILLLAVPMILEMVMESLFAVVDAFFVSSLGTNAIAVAIPDGHREARIEQPAGHAAAHRAHTEKRYGVHRGRHIVYLRSMSRWHVAAHPAAISRS